MLRGLLRKDILRGHALVAPGKFKVNKSYKSEIYILKPEEGGRSKPFLSGYRPQCFVRTADLACAITLPEKVPMGMPGDSLTINMKLDRPLCMDVGQRFALREGGKTVASGVVSEVIPDTEEDMKDEEA